MSINKQVINLSDLDAGGNWLEQEKKARRKSDMKIIVKRNREKWLEKLKKESATNRERE